MYRRLGQPPSRSGHPEGPPITSSGSRVTAERAKLTGSLADGSRSPSRSPSAAMASPVTWPLITSRSPPPPHAILAAVGADRATAAAADRRPALRAARGWVQRAAWFLPHRCNDLCVPKPRPRHATIRRYSLIVPAARVCLRMRYGATKKPAALRRIRQQIAAAQVGRSRVTIPAWRGRSAVGVDEQAFADDRFGVTGDDALAAV